MPSTARQLCQLLTIEAIYRGQYFADALTVSPFLRLRIYIDPYYFKFTVIIIYALTLTSITLSLSSLDLNLDLRTTSLLSIYLTLNLRYPERFKSTPCPRSPHTKPFKSTP